MHSTATQPEAADAFSIINQGDAALVIRPGGIVETFTFGVDQEKARDISSKNNDDLTEDEINIALQGQTLFLLKMASDSEAIMDLLGRLALTEGENNLSKIATTVRIQ